MYDATGSVWDSCTYFMGHTVEDHANSNVVFHVEICCHPEVVAGNCVLFIIVRPHSHRFPAFVLSKNKINLGSIVFICKLCI